MPVSQTPGTRAAAHEQAGQLTAFELTAFHDLVALTGSFVLGLAAAEEADSPEKIWIASRIDERWQEEQWGADAEARDAAALKRGQFEHACAFLKACRSASDDT
jgi:chaperone required for assembly of F1-ATPase